MKKDIYKTWRAAEKSMLKWDGRLTQFNRELVLQPLRVHEIHKNGLKDGTVFVDSRQRFTRLFNTYIEMNRLAIRRRKIMRIADEQSKGDALLNANCKDSADSKFYRINDYILLYTQGAKNEK